LTDAATENQVNVNVRNPMLWKSKFADTMLKMQLDVLTGEIRANCTKFKKKNWFRMFSCDALFGINLPIIKKKRKRKKDCRFEVPKRKDDIIAQNIICFSF
jgi:hypothetical protein